MPTITQATIMQKWTGDYSIDRLLIGWVGDNKRGGRNYKTLKSSDDVQHVSIAKIDLIIEYNSYVY